MYAGDKRDVIKWIGYNVGIASRTTRRYGL